MRKIQGEVFERIGECAGCKDCGTCEEVECNNGCVEYVVEKWRLRIKKAIKKEKEVEAEVLEADN